MAFENYTNAAQTTLNGNINGSVTSITVAGFSGFPVAGQFRILIDSEIMLVTGGFGTTTWTVSRGQESTIATSHSTLATVTHVLTMFGLLNKDWFDVRAYGAKADGITDDSTAINAALTAASANGGGTVWMPPNGPSRPYLIGSRLVVPFGVHLMGGGRNSCWVQASSSFPTSTELIRLGDLTGNIGVDCKVSDMHIDCGAITGSIGVYSERINENSGAYRMSINNYMSRGVQIKQPASGGTPQHYTLEELEFSSGATSPTSAIAVDIANTSLGTAIRSINNISIGNGGGAGTVVTTAMKIDGIEGGSIENCHFEGVTTGMLVGSVLGCFGLSIRDIDGNGPTLGVTNLITISNATTNRSVAMSGIAANGSTNSIVDQANSNTLTTDVGFYVMGSNSVIASDATIRSSVGGLLLSKDLRLFAAAPSFVSSYTPDPTTLGQSVTIFLTGNITVNNPTSVQAGHFLLFRWTQDGTGGRTITYGTNFQTNGAPSINTGANTRTIDTFYSFDGAHLTLLSRLTG